MLSRSSSSVPERSHWPWLAALLVVAATGAAYWGVGQNGFVAYDDPAFVLDNPMVRQGLTFAGVRWAFTSWYAASWQPVTWLSHMLDVQLFGMDPAWHHRVSVLLHALNAALLFAFLWRTTGSTWRSAVVAALFAVHPLRVESVAWVAERKDVLSGTFWFLALHAYVTYARKPSRLRFVTVMVLYGIGLLAKPMVITLPVALLLVDVWPLGRARPPWTREAWWPLLREKVPLLALAALSAAVTVLTQARSGALRSVRGIPFGDRAANALLAAVAYLRKSLWPSDLAVFYPHPSELRDGLPAAGVIAAGFVLVLLTVLAVRAARARPYLLAGWGWYLVTVLPVIGLIQVGRQGMADRYTYLPLIGPTFAATWGAAELASTVRIPRAVQAAVAAALALAAGWLTRAQVPRWHDTLTLFEHTAQVTRDNAMAWKNVGAARFERGELQQALAAFTEATRVDPDDPDLWFNRGMVLLRLGRARDAATALERSIALEPTDAQAWYNLGMAWAMAGRPERTSAIVERMRALDPTLAAELEAAARDLAR